MHPGKKYAAFKFALIGVLLIFTQSSIAQNTVVKTSMGYIKGVAEEQSIVFKGVPYAQPPIGDLRFKAPKSHSPWADTLLCDKFGSISAQYDGGQKKVIGSEDCLSLNIYQPANPPTGKMPVLVWIHGGGMTNGAGKGNNGHAFADNDGIITITINYRLGAFGFTYLGDVNKAYATSGNNGLLDCIMALKWIKQNISAFGGDPSKVTVMGQSAGGKLVSAIDVSPAAKGYYNQLIVESGGVQCIRDSGTAKLIRKRMLDSLSISSASGLLGLSAEKIIAAEAKVLSGAQGTNYFGPVDDGIVITGDPYQYIQQHGNSQIRVLMGTTKYESLLFMKFDPRLYHPDSIVLKGWFGNNYPQILSCYKQALNHNTADTAAMKVLTQYMYQMHVYRLAEALAKAGNQVLMYRFDYNKNGTAATHGQELSYVWYLPQKAKQVDSLLAVQVHGAWVSFIKGDNVLVGNQAWPAYNSTSRQVVIFDQTPYIKNLNHVYNDPSFPSACFVLKKDN
jgi:para-nitrobenzyl esterase